MQSLVIGTPAPFRRYIIENGTKSKPVIVLEKCKEFKVDYDTLYRNNEIIKFYGKEFGSKDPYWNTHHVQNVNDESLVEIAQAIGDLHSIILTGANYIRNKALSDLRMLSDKIVNIHFGDSCLYRGLDSNWWALLYRPHTCPAVTLHFVDTGIDTGAIVKKIQSPKRFSEMSLGELLYFEVEAANRLLIGWLNGDQGCKNKSTSYNNNGEYKSAMSSVHKHQAVANLRCSDI